MKLRAFLIVGLSALAVASCDALLEEEGSGPPPPDLPVPPPLDDEPLPIETATPEATPTPDMTASPMMPTTPEDDAPTPSPEGGPTPDPTNTSAALNGALPISDPTKMSIDERLAELALINAAPCDMLNAINSETVSELAEAKAAAPSGNLVSAAVVGGGMSAVSLTVLRADFPGIVKLEPKRVLGDGLTSSGHCGATRITNNWFVTAAHCLDESYDDIVLKVGFEILDKPITREIKADATVCHAAYGGSSGGYANDIALIHVDNETAAGLEDVPTARLVAAGASMTPLNTPKAKLAGWGMTAPGGALSNTLLGTEVSVSSVGPALIKVDSVEGRGPCIGDSGGPLFVTGAQGSPVLTGVLSGVEQESGAQACEGDYTARYTNLQGYLNWMQSVITTCDASAGLCLKN